MRLATHLVAASLVLFGGTTVAQAACDQPLTMGVESYAPFQLKEGGAWTGIDVDLVRAVFDRMGCELRLEELPWKRHLATMENGGDVHIAASASKTPEREAYARFSDPYRPAENVLIVNAGDGTDYGSLNAFFGAGQTLGGVSGYEYGPTVSGLVEAHADQVDMANDPETNLRKLSAGRIDGTIGDTFVMAATAREQDVSDGIRITDTVVDSANVHIMFAEKTVSQDLVERFNAALAALEADGTVGAIFDRYLN